MPALPTLDVTKAQADRMMAAFGSVENYKEWLRQQILHYVIDTEVEQVRLEVTQREIDKKAEVIRAMPAPSQPSEPVPVLPTI